MLHHRPDTAYRNYNQRFDALRYDTGTDAERAFAAWQQGRTGFPIVDAGMRQLLTEGWMHNRLRMIVASFLTKDLHLPWWWGAQHFMTHLVDGDLASNQHGWQWTAGCGTDAAPTSACSTRPRRERSSIRRVITCAAGYPNCVASRAGMSIGCRTVRRPDIRNRSSITPTNGRLR